MSYSRKMACSLRRGFSLMEIVVVIGIIGLLVALLIPAIQASRAAARKTQCLNNLRQIGLALQTYHSDHNVLPPTVVWGGPKGEPQGGGRYPVGLIDRIALGTATSDDPDRAHANWLIMLLPQLDQGPLWNSFDSSSSISSDANQIVRETVLSSLQCPSDDSSFQQAMYVRDKLAGGSSNKYARGNYAMNMGPGRGCIFELQPDCEDGFHVDNPDLAQENAVLWGAGAGGVNRSFGFKDMTAGTSHFAVVDEIRAGIHPLDPRGAWALGFAGASLTVRHGVMHRREDAAGPNNQHPGSDDIVGCIAMTSELGVDKILSLKMPCLGRPSNHVELNVQATARSRHPGGVHVLIADGSAHFVSDLVSAEVWFYMHSREPAEAFELPF